MPRRDGFPTNRELQVDFNAEARNVFVAASQRELEAKLEFCPAFEGKSLAHLFLRVSQDHYTEDGSPQAVRREELTVRPLTKLTADDLGGMTTSYNKRLYGNELFRDASDEVIEHYVTIAKSIGETAITDELRFDELSPTAIEADWTAYLGSQGLRTRHVATFKERPSKQSLVSARVFVGQSLDYVNSDQFDKPLSVRGANHLFGYGEDPRYSLRHWFGLDFSPHLALNGHESKVFLKAYSETMNQRLRAAREQLERFEALCGPGALLDDAKERVELYTKALNNAKQYL